MRPWPLLRLFVRGIEILLCIHLMKSATAEVAAVRAWKKVQINWLTICVSRIVLSGVGDKRRGHHKPFHLV